MARRRLVDVNPSSSPANSIIRIITAQLDPAAAGFPLQVFVTATLARHDPRSTRIFEDQVRALPQIVAADNVAGEMDYLLTVVARDVTDLQQVLANLAARGGQRLVTHLKLAEVKPVAAEAAGALGRPGVVVDLGCGLGSELGYLAGRGWHGIGVDLSVLALARARDGHPGMTFACADVTSLPLRGGAARPTCCSTAAASTTCRPGPTASTSRPSAPRSLPGSWPA